MDYTEFHGHVVMTKPAEAMGFARTGLIVMLSYFVLYCHQYYVVYFCVIHHSNSIGTGDLARQGFSLPSGSFMSEKHYSCDRPEYIGCAQHL